MKLSQGNQCCPVLGVLAAEGKPYTQTPSFERTSLSTLLQSQQLSIVLLDSMNAHLLQSSGVVG